MQSDFPGIGSCESFQRLPIIRVNHRLDFFMAGRSMKHTFPQISNAHNLYCDTGNCIGAGLMTNCHWGVSCIRPAEITR